MIRPSPVPRHRRRLRSLAAVAAVLVSACGCATSEPAASTSFCVPFEAAWDTYVERRTADAASEHDAPSDPPVADAQPAAPPTAPDARTTALHARDDLRQSWNALLEGGAAPSAAVVESVRTLDRNLLTAWSGGGEGFPGRIAGRQSFENGLGAVEAACARGGADVQLDAEGVPLGPEPEAPPSGTKR